MKSSALYSRLTEYLPIFEKIYSNCNKRELVHPDPLEFLYDYPHIADREIAGFIASSLAYGRVTQIIKSVGKVLAPLGNSPGRTIIDLSDEFLLSTYRDFRHRFTTGLEMAGLIRGLRDTVKEYGSIEAAFSCHIGRNKDFKTGIDEAVKKIGENGFTQKSSLLACPSGNSACKRLFLYLKWMVRKDEVDPGGWTSIFPKDLLMPVDTHILNISKRLLLTERKQADIKTVIEITDAFRSICPADPLKYDFVLTRFGIRNDMTLDDLFHKCGCGNS